MNPNRRQPPTAPRVPTLDDKLQAEAVGAAVAMMVPVLKSFMDDKPSREIRELAKPHAEKIAIAAISGWIAKRAEQATRKGMTSLGIDRFISLQPQDPLDDPVDDVGRAPEEDLLG